MGWQQHREVHPAAQVRALGIGDVIVRTFAVAVPPQPGGRGRKATSLTICPGPAHWGYTTHRPGPAHAKVTRVALPTHDASRHHIRYCACSSAPGPLPQRHVITSTSCTQQRRSVAAEARSVSGGSGFVGSGVRVCDVTGLGRGL